MSKDKDFDNWWNDDILDKSFIHPEDTPLYWAWQGWVAGRKAECEMCAKVCEAHAQVYANLPKSSATDAAWAACIDLQDAIRARGQG